jgi:hypothetical protein
MTRYLLAAVTLAGALFTANPANACDLEHCTWSKPVCDTHLISCDTPLWCSNLRVCP